MVQGILHVKLLNRPFTGGSNGEHHVDDGRLHNRAKSIIIVNPGAMHETPEDSVSLVVIECPVREELVHEDSLAGYDVGATGSGNKFPCPIAHQGLVLIPHSHAPIQISEGGMDRGRDGRSRCRGSHGDESDLVTRQPESVFSPV
jgi:hypothetical protein